MLPRHAAVEPTMTRLWLAFNHCVCVMEQDASPSGYYFQKSATGSDNWVIFLQGGGACAKPRSRLCRGM